MSGRDKTMRHHDLRGVSGTVSDNDHFKYKVLASAPIYRLTNGVREIYRFNIVFRAIE